MNLGQNLYCSLRLNIPRPKPKSYGSPSSYTLALYMYANIRVIQVAVQIRRNIWTLVHS